MVSQRLSKGEMFPMVSFRRKLPQCSFWLSALMLAMAASPTCSFQPMTIPRVQLTNADATAGTVLNRIGQQQPQQQQQQQQHHWTIVDPVVSRSVFSFGFGPNTVTSSSSSATSNPLRTTSLSSTVLFMAAIPKLDDWKILTNRRIVGTVSGHPSIPDGDVITTSPILRPDLAGPRKLVSTVSGSKYRLGVPASRIDTGMSAAPGGRGRAAPAVASSASSLGVAVGKISIQELQRQARVAFDLTGDAVGDETRQYLLAGRPVKSTSGKSQIYKAYQADEDGLPTGEPLTVKMSNRWDAIEREAENYAKITKAGLLRGQFIELLDFLPTASEYNKKLRNMSALVMERGTTDLKRFIAVNGPLKGKELREAAAAACQCIQAVHLSGLVWTDMKSENFVVSVDGRIKGIDLESAMPYKDNPVDYSPEGTPPEFAAAFLAGDGPYFVLDYSYDIWSLGMLMYEMSVGRGFFDGKTPVQITKTLRDGPEVILDPVPDQKLRDLIGQCLRINPKQRPGILQVLLHPYFITSGFGPFSF